MFGAFGGPGPSGFAAHMHMSLTLAYLVGLAQFCGALAMLTGIFARIGALCIATVMAGAVHLVHWKQGFDVNVGGYEYALTQLIIAIAVFVAGAGKFSLAPGKIKNW